ncbi:MAG: DUF7373 family lipoprotein [Nakamurella sp.]
MSSRKSALLSAVLATTLLAGCATSIGGTAARDVSVTAGPTFLTSNLAPHSMPDSTAVSGPTGPQTSATGSQTSATGSSGVATATTVPRSTPGSTPSAPTAPSPQPPSSTAGPRTGAAPNSYPSAPLQYNRTPTSPESANVLEAHRIANYLVVPSFIDGTYTRGADLSTLSYKGPASMSILFVDPMPAVAQRAGMITGFSSARGDGSKNALVVAAFEFPTDAKATAAVPAFVSAVANSKDDKGEAAVPGFKAAAGRYGTSGTQPYFQAFLAQGRMVLYLYISGPGLKTPALQAALAAKTFTAQTAAMSHYTPTAADKLMQLPVDPGGLRAHTLPNSKDDATVNDGVFTAAGQLHFDSDPITTKAIFDSAGVDVVADGRASVYRARDANGAKLVQADFIASTQSTQKSMQPYQPTSGAADRTCLQQALSSYYYCVGTSGRYAYELSAKSEADINAALTAQAALLAGL